MVSVVGLTMNSTYCEQNMLLVVDTVVRLTMSSTYCQ